MEGPLSKWTNVMKGWQYRWFVLDYNAGLLSYYTVRIVLFSVKNYLGSSNVSCHRLSQASRNRGLRIGSWDSQLAKVGEGCQ